MLLPWDALAAADPAAPRRVARRVLFDNPEYRNVQISPDGRFLFTVNTASGTISRYSIAAGGTLTLLGSTTIRGTGGLGAVDAGLTPGGHFLYVDESEGKVVGAFAVNGGSLTELSSSPFALPSSASAAGITVS